MSIHYAATPVTVRWERKQGALGCTSNRLLPPTPCSKGGDLHMTQFFRGDLAGLTIRSGKLTDKKVIDCLYTCKEGLDLQVPEDGGRGVKVTRRLHSGRGPLNHTGGGCRQRIGLRSILSCFPS